MSSMSWWDEAQEKWADERDDLRARLDAAERMVEQQHRALELATESNVSLANQRDVAQAEVTKRQEHFLEGVRLMEELRAQRDEATALLRRWVAHWAGDHDVAVGDATDDFLRKVGAP